MSRTLSRTMSRTLTSPRTPTSARPPVPRELARDLAARPELWAPAVRFTRPRYSLRFATGPDWEAWLLTWLPGQSTGLHDHGGSSGAFTVVSGAVDEAVLLPAAAVTPTGAAVARRAATRLRSRRYRIGEVRSFGPDHLHEVAARAGLRAVTLHVYTPRLVGMTRYAVGDAGLVATAHERAGEDW